MNNVKDRSQKPGLRTNDSFVYVQDIVRNI